MQGLSQQQIAQFKEAFALFDKDSDNRISTSELPFVIRSLGQTPTEKQLQEWIKEVDPNGTSKVDFPEFLSLMARKYKEPDTEDELIEAMKSIFNLSENESVNIKIFKNTMTSLGEKLTEEEIEELFRETDLGKEDHFSMEEFVRIILSK